MKTDDVRRIDFFECDCYSKEDLIRAEYSDYTYDFADGRKQVDRELQITFSTLLADYNATWSKNVFIRFFNRFAWRIKNSFKIFFTGEIKTEGFFVPSRSLVDSKKDTVENLFGYETTKNFANWLDKNADKIKEDYEKDIENYNKIKKGTL